MTSDNSLHIDNCTMEELNGIGPWAVVAPIFLDDDISFLWDATEWWRVCPNRDIMQTVFMIPNHTLRKTCRVWGFQSVEEAVAFALERKTQDTLRYDEWERNRIANS